MQLVTIRLITPQDTYVLRQEVLRPGKPESSCYFPGDFDVDTYHFGVYQSEKLVGILSLFRREQSLFEDFLQYQLRGMAVDEAYRVYGLGSRLIKEAEGFLRKKGIDLLWLNARETAVKFYEKSGYCVRGECFQVSGIGTHYLMYKKL